MNNTHCCKEHVWGSSISCTAKEAKEGDIKRQKRGRGAASASDGKGLLAKTWPQKGNYNN